METLLSEGVKQFNDLPDHYFNYKMFKVEQNDGCYRFEIRTNVVELLNGLTEISFFVSTIHSPMIDIDGEINDKMSFIYRYIKSLTKQNDKKII